MQAVVEGFGSDVNGESRLTLAGAQHLEADREPENESRQDKKTYRIDSAPMLRHGDRAPWVIWVLGAIIPVSGIGQTEKWH